jgi:hypothetical protein
MRELRTPASLLSGLLLVFAWGLGSCTQQEEFDSVRGQRSPDAGVVVFPEFLAGPSCPHILFYRVSPLQTAVGGRMRLRAIADDDSGEPVSIQWTGTGGDVADVNSENTNYTCRDAGPQSITLSVMNVDGCEVLEHVDVTCM